VDSEAKKKLLEGFPCKPDESKTEVISELVGILIDVIDSPNVEQEAKEFAPQLDELSKRLFSWTLV
jgi:hypothetical protein